MTRRIFFLAWLVWGFVATDMSAEAQTKPATPPKAAAPKAADAPKAAPPAAGAAPKAAEAPKPGAPAAADAPKPADPKVKSTPKPGAEPKPVMSAKVPEMALARLASEKSVFSLVSNGWKKPDAKSSNKTEKLWAEQSVQDFVQQLTDEIKKTIEQQTEGNENSSLLGSTIPKFACAALQHPLSVSLASFTIAEIPEIKLALVIDAESDADSLREAFEKLIDAAPEDGPGSLAEETIEGATFYRPEVPDQGAALAPQFGMYKSYLIFTMGPETTAETIAKINGKGKSPAWLDATFRELKVERPSLAWQIDVDAIWKIVDPLIQDATVRTAMDGSGVFTLKRVASATGLDAVGIVDKLVIETSEAPRGIFALLPNKPLSASDLKGIPANPAQATVIRFDLELLVESILKMADTVDSMPRQRFDMASEQGESILGFSIKNDLLKGFGDLWSTYVSSTEAGGGLVPGLVIAVTARDQKKLTKVQDALVAHAKDFLQQLGPQAPVALHDFTAKGAKGYRVQINNLPIPVAPSWVITKDQFVLGLSPQLVTAHLGVATASTSLANNEDVKAALKRDPKTLMISYRDPKPEIQGLYTIVNMFSPIVLGQLQQQGINFDFPPLPPFSDIEPHLAPSVSTLTQTPTGWQSESHGVVPSLSAASPAVAAVGVALLLPAVQQAREAARRTQAKNNLKMIGLAMHNYHDTFTRFPERVVLDKEGKPGLSWRVKLLPYLDEAALYNEFHLDEPWDSEHNKALLERMPAAYASPNEPELAKEGKTRYVVLSAEGTLFDGEEGPRIADVTDGTSNTIMVVEARADHAVNWTEPEDLEVDFDDVIAGLESARVGGFHALLCDGSVRFVSDNINADILKALMTRAGGEVIGDF